MPPKRASVKQAEANHTSDSKPKAKKPKSASKATDKTSSSAATKSMTTTTSPKATSKRKASETEIADKEEGVNIKRPRQPRTSATSDKVLPAESVTSSTKAASRKRKPSHDNESDVTSTKRSKTADGPKTSRPTKKITIKDVTTDKSSPKKTNAGSKSLKNQAEINQPPAKALHVFVFGEGSQGELGLGSKNEPGRAVIDVKRPRLNLKLEKLNVVQIAVGGMHCAALTADNKIYTWGVNDQGALGRETIQEGKMKDISADDEDDDSDSDDDSEDSGLNPSEAEPRQIDPKYFPDGTRFASLFAGDSTTFALTTTGLVFGWGTFRGNDGVLGFSKDSTGAKGKKTQAVPKLIPELKQVKTMAIGTNHALALTHKGKAFVWGAGEQSQLGRRVVARTASGALVPREFGFQRKTIVDIATGDYFSYAVEKNGTVYAWGHNGYGQTGIPTDQNVDDIIPVPTVVDALNGRNIQQLAGGNHHTIARTRDGEVLVWGRLDNLEGGLKIEDMPEDSLIRNQETGRVLASKTPITVPGIEAQYVATGTDTNFAIDKQGKAYSWGFSTNYQTGLGTSDDVVEATLVDNTAVRDKKLIFAGVGGQFGVLACQKEAATASIKS